MTTLVEKKCQVCEGGIPALNKSQAEALIKDVAGWHLSEDAKYITRDFTFKGFYAVMGFVNAVAFIVQREGHHPDISLGYNYCTVKFTTHAVDGLTENDFICAAKINALIA